MNLDSSFRSFTDHATDELVDRDRRRLQRRYTLVIKKLDRTISPTELRELDELNGRGAKT